MLNYSILNSQVVESFGSINSPVGVELYNLFSTYEMEGLMQAHDQIALETDLVSAANDYETPSLVNEASMETATAQTVNQNIVNNNVLKVSDDRIWYLVYWRNNFIDVQLYFYYSNTKQVELHWTMR